MPQPIPYLAFDGNCADAMRFYASALGGKLDLQTFGQSPMADQTPENARNKIMHARLALEGNGSLYAGDCPPAAIPAEMCYLGWQESLSLLALLVEAAIPAG